MRRGVARDAFTGLSQLLQSGMAAVTACRTLVDTAHPVVATGLQAVAARLEQGDGFAEACRAAPRLFRVPDVALLSAFEEVGDVPGGLQALAEQADDALVVRRQLLKSVAYPMLVLVSHIVITPVPKAVFQGPEAYFRDVLRHGGILVAVLVAIVWVVPAILRATPLGARLKALAWRLPWPATVWVHHARAVFHRTLARNIGAGLELFRATRSAAAATNDPSVVERVEPTLNAIVAEGFSQPIARTGMVRPQDMMLLVSGERSGTLEQTLKTLAERYADARQRAIRWLMNAVGTLLALAIVALVTFSILDAYRGITSAADGILDSLDSESPLRGLDAKDLEGLDLEGLDLEQLKGFDLKDLGL